MTENSKKPRIRFKGFTEAWEQRKVNDLTNRFDNLRVPVTASLRISGNTPYYGANGIQDYVSGYTHKGEFILIAEDGANDLKNYPVQYVNGEIWVNNHAHVLQSKGKISDSKFLKYSISNSNIESVLVGGGRAKLNADVLMNIDLSVPKYPEQKELGEFFTDLDNLITLHQRKYDKLLNVKKALLEKMFPKNGKNTPEIRFKGFTEAWEQRKVGEVSSLRGRIGFRGYTREDLVNSHEGAITFSPSDIDDEGHLSLANNDYISFEKYEESPEIKVEVGDILFTKTASIGKVAFVKELQEKATINPQFALISPNRKINNYFQFLSMRLKPFMKKVWDITGGSSIPTMSQEKLKELSFHVPLLEEQKNISDLFSNLDNLITLHQRECEKLKNVKKSLLEKMFV